MFISFVYLSSEKWAEFQTETMPHSDSGNASMIKSEKQKDMNITK